MTGRLFLELVLIVFGTALAAELCYLLVLRPWLDGRRYDRENALHRRSSAADFWGDTGDHDTLWDAELTGQLDPLPSQPWARAWEPQPRTRTVNHAPWDSAQFPAITDLPGVPSNGKHARQHNLPGTPPVDIAYAQDASGLGHGRAGEPALLQPEVRIPGATGNPPEEAKTGAVLAPASIAPVPLWPVTVINLTIVRQQVIMPPLHEAYERTAGYGDHGWQPAQAGIYTGSLQYVQDILDAEYVDGQLMLEGAA